MPIKVNFLILYCKIHKENFLNWVKTSVVSVYFSMRFLILLICGSSTGRKTMLESEIFLLSFFCFAYMPLWSVIFTIPFPWTSHRNWELQVFIQYGLIKLWLLHLKIRWHTDNTLCENYNKLYHLMHLSLTLSDVLKLCFLYWGWFL